MSLEETCHVQVKGRMFEPRESSIPHVLGSITAEKAPISCHFHAFKAFLIIFIHRSTGKELEFLVDRHRSFGRMAIVAGRCKAGERVQVLFQEAPGHSRAQDLEATA